MSPDVASAAIRGLTFLMVFQATGSVFFLVLLGHALDRSARTVRRVAQTAALLGVVALASHVLLDAARLTGEYTGLFNVDMQRLALRTTGAVSRVVQMAGLLAVAYGMRKEGRSGRPLALAGSVIAVTAFLLAGHTAAHEWRMVLAPLLLLHLAVVAFWFGSLVPLCLALRYEPPRVAAAVLAEFSRFAVWSVPLLAVAGVVLVLGIARGLPRFDEPYGTLILTKVSAFVVLMGVAGLNKLRLVPAIGRGQRSASNALQVSMVIEAVIMFGVLATTAVMTSFFSP